LKSVIEKQYRSRLTAVVKAERLAGRVTRRLDLAEDDRMDIAIAVTEAVINAVLHGNCQHPDKLVTVRFELSAAQVRIIVRDQGEGFDLGSVADPLSPENITKPNGRGLLIVESLMDSVQVKHTPHGTEVIMVKRR
jgi:serine/threonine-protein kinase RsbW